MPALLAYRDAWVIRREGRHGDPPYEYFPYSSNDLLTAIRRVTLDATSKVVICYFSYALIVCAPLGIYPAHILLGTIRILLHFSWHSRFYDIIVITREI